VAKNGTIVFSNEWQDVSPRGAPGTVLMWLRKGDGPDVFSDPPEQAPDGTVLQAEVHLP
jgi:hypothetical protein